MPMDTAEKISPIATSSEVVVPQNETHVEHGLYDSELHEKVGGSLGLPPAAVAPNVFKTPQEIVSPVELQQKAFVKQKRLKNWSFVTREDIRNFLNNLKAQVHGGGGARVMSSGAPLELNKERAEGVSGQSLELAGQKDLKEAA